MERYKFPKTNFPFVLNQRGILKVEETPNICDWAEEHFRLGISSASSGKIKLHPFQRLALDYIHKFHKSIFIGPVQTGKSMMTEIIAGYLIDTTTENMFWVYEKKDQKLTAIFKERLSPMITDIPTLSRYWSGREDDLTQTKISLRHLIIRIASAGRSAASDISTFNAGGVFMDEIGKWPVQKGFNQIKALEGRLQSTIDAGREPWMIGCTSPVHTQDMSYKLCHTQDMLFVRPYFPCPHCSDYIQFHLENIIEIPNSDGDKDHNSVRIIKDNAAYYKCQKCGGKITGRDRLLMTQEVKLFPVNKKDKHKRIFVKEEDYNGVVVNWHRLVMNSYTFAHALAGFYKARRATDPSELQTYKNEDWAHWVKYEAQRYSESFLQGKTKIHKYYQFGPNASIPDFVRFLMVGIDSQDDGFYIVIRGYGASLESALVRQELLPCSMSDSKYKDKREILKLFIDMVHNQIFKTKNGRILKLNFGLIDRGGHRPHDVDFICQYIPWLHPYIGATKSSAQTIEQKPNHFYGNTKNLSRIVATRMKGTGWHLPIDFDKDYGKQVLNQYDEVRIDSHGCKKTEFRTTIPDHYRDCENLIEGSVIICDLGNVVFDGDKMKKMDTQTTKQKKIEKKDLGRVREEDKNDNFIKGFTNEMKDNGW